MDPPYTFTFDENRMSGGRQSDHALIMRSTSDSWLTLYGDYRFSGGTAIERGTLILGWGSTTLISNATVSPLGELWLGATLQGNLVNNGRVVAGQMHLDPSVWSAENLSRIEGNYEQSATGTLSFTLDWPLQITGRAQLNGGTAELRARRDFDGARYVYYLPTTPSSQWLLHADGGVFGQFNTWTSPGLFVEGNLRYAPNDVYFDLTRISLLDAMAAAAKGDAATLDTARNIDNAFLESDRYATIPATALTATQRGFLQSAAAIQHLGNHDEAVKVFDSLSGHGHVAAVDALLHGTMTSKARSSAQVDARGPGSQAGFWSGQAALVATAAGTFTHSQSAGYEHWLNDRLLLGSSFGWSEGELAFDRSGGSARSQSPQWNLYLHRYADNGNYALGDVGYSHHQLSLDRPIDLGNRMHNARSERQLDAAHAYIEVGREMELGDARLMPFAAMNYAALRSEGFVEQGDTGFELTAGSSLHQRVSGDVGLRYARHWRGGASQWMRLDLGAGYEHLLGASDGMRAAFTGTPDAEFDVAGMPRGHGNGWVSVNLAGGGNRWSWLLSYDVRASNQAASLGVELGF